MLETERKFQSSLLSWKLENIMASWKKKHLFNWRQKKDRGFSKKEETEVNILILKVVSKMLFFYLKERIPLSLDRLTI